MFSVHFMVHHDKFHAILYGNVQTIRHHRERKVTFRDAPVDVPWNYEIVNVDTGRRDFDAMIFDPDVHLVKYRWWRYEVICGVFLFETLRVCDGELHFGVDV